MRIWSLPGIYPFPEKGDYSSGIFIHKQNLALAKLGIEVNVIQTRDWYPVWPFRLMFADWQRNYADKKPKERLLDGIKVFHPVVFTPKPSRIFNRPHREFQIDAICNFLKKQGVKPGKDVILAQWLIPDGFMGVIIAKRLGIHVAVEMQGDDIQVWPHDSPAHLRDSLWTLENADLMLGCSDFLCNEAKKLYQKPLEAHTIYTGIDTDKFKPLSSSQERESLRADLGVAPDQIAILNVGSSIARKGWNELFQAVATLKVSFPNIKIVAASGGLKEFTLPELAKKYHVEDNLIDLGNIPNHQLPALYQAADIFCLPSYWEGLANVLCEAMSSGCAIVTTAVSGHPEVVFPGINGELVEPKNVEQLTEALRKLVNSKELRASYGAEARKTAISKIKSHDENAIKLFSLLKEIV